MYQAWLTGVTSADPTFAHHNDDDDRTIGECESVVKVVGRSKRMRLERLVDGEVFGGIRDKTTVYYSIQDRPPDAARIS